MFIWASHYFYLGGCAFPRQMMMNVELLGVTTSFTESPNQKVWLRGEDLDEGRFGMKSDLGMSGRDDREIESESKFKDYVRDWTHDGIKLKCWKNRG